MCTVIQEKRDGQISMSEASRAAAVTVALRYVRSEREPLEMGQGESSAGKLAAASGPLPHNFVTLHGIGLRGFVKGALTPVSTLHDDPDRITLWRSVSSQWAKVAPLRSGNAVDFPVSLDPTDFLWTTRVRFTKA
ncbi:uncharacterized protein LOC143213448 isoform X1 [Lasioglossum baleicum]|uniref:uncharacterized protein LOC143213448 isoform X1 n=1 Tax=Lasioglossum baleicum TaxID=434251 RepID=UPI003FCE7D30